MGTVDEIEIELNVSVDDSVRKKGADINCSFCGKHLRDVLKMVAGPMVYICNECVETCLEIMNGPQKSFEEMGEMQSEGKEDSSGNPA